MAVPLGLTAGAALDRWLGDPRRWHPVAGFGRAASSAERRLYADSRASGTVFTTVLVGGPVLAAVLIRRRSSPLLEMVGTAAATWAVLGGTSLLAVADAVADDLDRDDVEAARLLIPSLCARDPAHLDAAGIGRAALESVAENTSDATVGPLLWGAVAGLPGLVGYRAINTLDAMVGYRSDRYLRFGWASARLDDVANLAPARLSAALTVVSGNAPRRAVMTWRRDARRHPSPNAGVVEATMAGALGIRLGGPTIYPYGVDDRPVLGAGRSPGPADLRAAIALSERIQLGALLVAVGVRLMIDAQRRRRRRISARSAH